MITGSAAAAAGAAICEELAVAQREGPKTGARIYREACAACHGVDGKGSMPSQVGFDVPLPDFTDCEFAPREPNADWLAVTHRGGPARAFDEMMPAFGEAFTPEETVLVVNHLRTLCRDKSWPRGELNLPRGLITEKAFPEDEAVMELDVGVEGPIEVSGRFIYEQRIGSRGQLELVVPWGVRERSDEELAEGAEGIAEGAGDIAVGGKYALFHSFDTMSIFSLAAELKLPTGDEADGYGKGVLAFEPFLAYGQEIPVVGFVQLQGGAEIPFDLDRADPEFFGRAGLGQSFAAGVFGRTFTPMVELELKGEIKEDEIELAGAAVPQIQISLSQRQHVLWNVGYYLPLNKLDERQATVMTYLLWDWFDGGFFEGW